MPIDYSYITPVSMLVVSSLFPACSIVFVVLRFYVRRAHKMPHLVDDWLILPALVCRLCHLFNRLLNASQLLTIGMGIALIIGMGVWRKPLLDVGSEH